MIICNFYKRAYKLENLYLAKLGISLLTSEEEDTIFLLEREVTNLDRGGLGVYEAYLDILTGIPVSIREGSIEELQKNLPKEIKELMPIPREYLTEFELSSGIIPDLRVYQIFRQINLNRDFIRN